MTRIMKRPKLLAWLLVVALAAPCPASAQTPAPPPAAQPAGSAPVFTSEQLEQLGAPIALYPDPLLAQVLMASTYPLEIVRAARFVRDHKDLKGDQLDEALKDQTTKIGKYVLNHSFMIPGLVATFGAVLTGSRWRS